MSLSTVCPYCQSQLSLRDDLVQKRFRCPRCQQILQVQPQPSDTSPNGGGTPWAEDAGRQRRRRRRFWAPARDPGMTGGELALFGTLFLLAPVVNAICGTVLYLVWQSDQPRRAAHVRNLGWGLFLAQCGLAFAVWLGMHLTRTEPSAREPTPVVANDRTVSRPSRPLANPPRRQRFTTFTCEEFGFRVKMPSQPDRSVQDWDGHDVHVFRADADGVAYVAHVVDVPVSDDEPVSRMGLLLDRFSDGVLTGTVTRLAKIKLHGRHPGRERESTETGGWVRRVRYYLVDGRIYLVGVTAQDGAAQSTSATEFLDSFALMD